MTSQPVYFNAKFHDFPWIKPQVCPMNDDDIQFHSDMQYFRALLNDIAELVYAKRYANPLPINLCDDLDAAISSLGEVRWK
jgi:hypothetical protein